jgi:hypothetical protein
MLSPVFKTSLLAEIYSKEEPAGTGAFFRRYVESPDVEYKYKSIAVLVVDLLALTMPITINVEAPVAVRIVVAESDATAVVRRLDFVTRLKVFAMSTQSNNKSKCIT